ncbi:hypothetical protein J6590_013747 [Homalodisca vitripennis]|nr:hypothetical protein J6590_013747 [Homalodisca vitripennis]
MITDRSSFSLILAVSWPTRLYEDLIKQNKGESRYSTGTGFVLALSLTQIQNPTPYTSRTSPLLNKPAQ